jgi:hypothetical protein
MKIKISANHLKRYKEICLLLWKYGRSDLVQQMGIEVLASRANYNASQPLRRSKRSTPLRLELPHILHQPLHALDREGVVDRGAHAADGAVAFELHHAARFRAF